MKAQVKKIATRGTAACALASAMAFAAPTLAFAAEKETAGISAILPAMDEFIPMLVAFIILWIILAKFGWPLFDGMLKKREDTIKNSLEKSEEARQESERLLAEYREQLEGAKAQAQQMLNNARQSCDAMESEAKQKAQEEAAAIVAKAKVAIEAEKQSAISELKGSVVDLSVDIATRVIGEDFSDEEHRKLIERYVKEAGSLNA